jgi:hypothetical protein
MAEERGQRAGILVASVAVTAGVAYLAFLLGAWGFNTRRYATHEGRLKKLLLATPRLPQVVQAFEEEGSPLVASPAGRREVERVAGELAGAKKDDVMAKAARWPQVRVFRAGDMVYFVFFDRAGVMRDYAFVSR